MLVGGVIALYSSRLALDQAGEQEARAQSGANRAEDADLGRFSAVLARARPATHYPPYAWVFPQALSEATVAELAKPSRQWFVTEGEKLSRDEMKTFLEERDAHKRDLGGVLCLWHTTERLVSKSATKHLVSLVGNRREKVRVVDLRARVLEQSPRMNGTLLKYPSEGSTPIESVTIDLDDPSGRLVATDAEGVERPLLDAKSITLEQGEEIGLEITAMAAAASYRWELEVTVEHSVANRETVRIRADGTSDGPAFLTPAWRHEDAFAGGFYYQDNSTYALVKAG